MQSDVIIVLPPEYCRVLAAQYGESAIEMLMLYFASHHPSHLDGAIFYARVAHRYADALVGDPDKLYKGRVRSGDDTRRSD